LIEDSVLVKDDFILIEEAWVSNDIRLDTSRIFNIVFGKILFQLLEDSGQQNVYGI
jgi:hypothetical protein